MSGLLVNPAVKDVLSDQNIYRRSRPSALGLDSEAVHRDQALVFLLAYSGARSAELVTVSDDADRNGLRWRHVNLDAGTMQVFGKNRTRESAPILDEALRPLQLWKQLQDPSDDDAVFPRLDNATNPLDPTPSITTQSSRNILADLCEWSDYEFEAPLKPHGARRGLGREIYRESPQVAQDVLRHKSIETTHEGYTQETAKRTRDEQTISSMVDDRCYRGGPPCPHNLGSKRGPIQSQRVGKFIYVRKQQ